MTFHGKQQTTPLRGWFLGALGAPLAILKGAQTKAILRGEVPGQGTLRLDNGVSPLAFQAPPHQKAVYFFLRTHKRRAQFGKFPS